MEIVIADKVRGFKRLNPLTLGIENSKSRVLIGMTVGHGAPFETP